MRYADFVGVYEALSKTSKRLEKTALLASFLRILHKEGKSEWIYLLQGKVLPDYDVREFGISRQLMMKAIATSFGASGEYVIEQFNKVGDLGEIAELLATKRRQSVLFTSTLEAEKVFETLRKILDISGKGTVDKKIAFVSELLASASPSEAKYIVRTILNDLRVGLAGGLLRDAIASAFFAGDPEINDIVQGAYDLSNDFAEVFDAAAKGKTMLQKIGLRLGKPMQVMLAVKADDITEAFRICGTPAAVEFKYDGFRVLVHKDKSHIKLFTRKLEEVSTQFPDVIEAIRQHVKAETCILDAEVVGFDPKTKKYLPFEAVSQRIKRKYDIEKLKNSLPVEVNVFDVLYIEGKSILLTSFRERRELLEKIVETKTLIIRPSMLKIVSSEEDALAFYDLAIQTGEEGIMIKNLDAPYQQGRRVGYMVKLKPTSKDLDVVIVGAEYGTGKRAGWLTSYIVACQSPDGFLEVGKVSSGLKEKDEEGTSYGMMSELLHPLIIGKENNMVRVSPKIVVSVTYQNIQPSPSYSSGYALRFPRITAYRPDRKAGDIATLADIEAAASK